MKASRGGWAAAWSRRQGQRSGLYGQTHPGWISPSPAKPGLCAGAREVWRSLAALHTQQGKAGLCSFPSQLPASKPCVFYEHPPPAPGLAPHFQGSALANLRSRASVPARSLLPSAFRQHLGEQQAQSKGKKHFGPWADALGERQRLPLLPWIIPGAFIAGEAAAAAQCSAGVAHGVSPFEKAAEKRLLFSNGAGTRAGDLSPFIVPALVPWQRAGSGLCL